MMGFLHIGQNVMVNDRSARQYCSQGQVRTAALALKLAEREIHRDTFGEYPVSWIPCGRNMCSTASPADRCSSPAAKMTGWIRF